MHTNRLYDGLAFDLPRTDQVEDLITMDDGTTDEGTPCLVLKYLVDPTEQKEE